ncbi:tail fiber protein [Leucobacter aridicollis]|nr:tail fiber protein [Leucobacter aridicollis]
MIGSVLLTAGAVADGMPANGQILSIQSFSALYSLFGNTYGGDGRATFALPDMRGLAPNNMTYSICVYGIFPSRD